MDQLPQDVLGRWMHSFEEDSGGTRVYRPADHDFPPARGRDGIEFRADGSFIEWAIGPADAPRGLHGHWRVESPGRVTVSYEGDARPTRTLTIQEHDPTLLKLRE